MGVQTTRTPRVPEEANSNVDGVAAKSQAENMTNLKQRKGSSGGADRNVAETPKTGVRLYTLAEVQRETEVRAERDDNALNDGANRLMIKL
jgi:hypothetical protein